MTSGSCFLYHHKMEYSTLYWIVYFVYIHEHLFILPRRVAVSDDPLSRQEPRILLQYRNHCAEKPYLIWLPCRNKSYLSLQTLFYFKYNTCTKRRCHYNKLVSKLPDGFHNALFTNLLAAPLSILRDAMTKQIEKNNNNNSSLSLINPQTATYKLPLPVNKIVHLNFVNRKQQALTIFLASF